MPFTLPPEANDGQAQTQAERTARAETRMVLAAIDLLKTEGIQGTTLVAIGEKSGYSRGLATHHFGSDVYECLRGQAAVKTVGDGVTSS